MQDTNALTFDIKKEVAPEKTFRVASVMGKFDLQSNRISEHFKGEINLPDKWSIGLIVGKSGTGKTTIAKQLFPGAYVTNFKYGTGAILDDMPQGKSIEEITKAFNAVGFSSPPSWLKPYEVLSNGEKMRVDLARAILEEKKLFLFDEFTSVVDRQVAKIGSFAMQKAIRKTDKQFIASTCHADVEDWLLPDWIFSTDTMTFTLSQKKNRPNINLKIFETTRKNNYWKMFGKYHYLSHSHNNAARVFVLTIENEIAGFCSVLHMPHPKIKMKKVHRLVMLPDYQGLSLGIKFLNEVAKIYTERFSITTSSPSLVFGLKHNQFWRCGHIGRKKPHTGSTGSTGSNNRITTSWEYTPVKALPAHSAV